MPTPETTALTHAELTRLISLVDHTAAEAVHNWLKDEELAAIAAKLKAMRSAQDAG